MIAYTYLGGYALAAGDPIRERVLLVGRRAGYRGVTVPRRCRPS